MTLQGLKEEIDPQRSRSKKRHFLVADIAVTKHRAISQAPADSEPALWIFLSHSLSILGLPFSQDRAPWEPGWF